MKKHNFYYLIFLTFIILLSLTAKTEASNYSIINVETYQDRYKVPADLSELLTSDESFSKFAAQVRPDIEKQNPTYTRELIMLDINDGKLDSALLHIKTLQETEKKREGAEQFPFYDLVNLKYLEIIVKALQKSDNVKASAYQKVFLVEFKKHLDELSYLEKCGFIRNYVFLNAYSREDASLDRERFNETLKNKVNPVENTVDLQTALNLIEYRMAYVHLFPMIKPIAEFVRTEK